MSDKTHIQYADNLRGEILRKIAAGSFVYSEFFPGSKHGAMFLPARARVTVGSLLDARERLYAAAVANRQLSPSTRVGYVKAIVVLRKTWEDKTLQQLTPAALREWIAGLGLTGKAVRNLLTPLRSLCEDALADELIEFDPFDRLPLKKLLRETARRSDYEPDPFDAAERAALLRAAREDERALVQFWFATGLRPGELMALAWPKIDWVHGRARIDANLVVGIEKAPKTASGIRDVDLDAAALAALAEQKPRTFLANGKIWMNPRTGQPWEHEAQIRKTLWESLCKRAGVRYRSPYQIRHTYVSEALSSGDPVRSNPWYLAQQAGHRDVEMIFRTYGRWIGEAWRKPRIGEPIARESDAGKKTA